MRFGPAGTSLLATTLLAAQPGVKPGDLYQRARQGVLDAAARLPNYTCVQTITRRVYGTSSQKKRVPKCDELVRDREIMSHNLPLLLWDRLRVDVAIVEKHEVYSWVGAARFDENDLRQLIGARNTSTGLRVVCLRYLQLSPRHAFSRRAKNRRPTPVRVFLPDARGIE